MLEHAVDAHRKNIKVYESLRNLNEVVGTEYGDRVLYELIQNAHDAHRSGDRGRIAVSLTIRSESEGTLCVANGGAGFRWRDVDAIMNLATTAKEIGESIGNKGLGFRSVEALTDDVRIFSRRGGEDSKRFDGYCFRFAQWDEIEKLLRDDGTDTTTARIVARTVPRYLVPLPLTGQPDEIVSYARRGYASVIVLPLRGAESIELARQQVQALADLDVPLLLFLDRIADFRIDVRSADGSVQQRRLTRRQNHLGCVPGIADCRLHEVRVGEDRRFLLVQRKVDKARVLNAVKRSVPRAPQIKRWAEWKGQPTVSVAVGLSPGALTTGHVYNFLPMGNTAVAPLLGHLDAPFFADIDRRDADFDLPLNTTLMTAAAEACAHAALYLVGQAVMIIPQHPIFDLVAWTGKHAGKLDAALDGMGSSLADAPVVPVVAVDGIRWTSLTEAKLWPGDTFSLMKAPEVAKRTGARLVSPEINGGRLHRLKTMANRKYLGLAPSGQCLAEWSERFASSLADRQAAPRTWSRFYEDLNRVFDAADEKLQALAGKEIILDRSKNLQPAGGHGGASGVNPFVRDESTRRRRAKGGVPLPPATLTRRYRFVDEKIRFKRDTLNAFIGAGLVRLYDPVEALAGLGSTLGKRTNDNRRREALTWAFSVSRFVSTGIQEALRSAQLQVPTSSGWKPATQTAFSSSWTPVGRTLENFLVEAADMSPDCQRARDALLATFANWPSVPGATKRQWIEFLKLLGVVDGLQPVAAAVQEDGDGRSWDSLVRNFDSVEDQRIPALCHRAGCWPEGMAQTLETGILGLDAATVEAEAKRRRTERERKIIEERSIDFAGTRLDPGDPSSFAEAFQQLAEQNIAVDEGWFERSRRPRLAEFREMDGGGRPPGGGTGGGNGRRRKQPPEDQRQAMGLASEWLVFQYLRRRYGEAVDETCWVSRNRARFFGGDEGDDSAGYDFCVKTPQVEWLYEVKSSLADAGEFELTPNEMRVAASVPARRGRRQYRILYVPFVFSPDRWMVLELPNPMGEGSRNRFKQVGRGSVRFQFERSAAQRSS